MANIGTLTAYIGMNTARLQADQMHAQRMFSSFADRSQKSLGRITSAVGRLSGALAALGIGMGGLALFKSITQTGVRFEQTMATVAGVMRANADESKRLTEAARKMGETTEWSASQAGNALQFLGMAGFEANKAVAALPGTLDLATAGQIELGRAADIATNALTAMGLEVNELTRVNDVFVGTITRSNTNMEMMAESFKYAAPVARAYGYSIEELAALIGMLGNAGIQGSMAGTQLAMAIQKSNEVAKDFGVEGGHFIDVLEQLRAKGVKSTDVMTAFGLRAGRAAGVLYEATGATREFQTTLGNVSGEAARLADKMRSTLGGTFKELKSVIESLALDVFETYREDLKLTLEATISWIRENKDKITKFAEGIKVAFKGIVEVITGIPGFLVFATEGFDDFFKHLREEAEATKNIFVDMEELMQRRLGPPELTPWQKFWNALVDGWMAVAEVIRFILRAVETLIAGMINHLIEAVGVLDDFRKKLTSGDIKGAWKALTQPELKSPQVMFGAWTDQWNDMMESLGIIKPKVEQVEPGAFDPTIDVWGHAIDKMREMAKTPAMTIITAEEYEAAVRAKKLREEIAKGIKGTEEAKVSIGIVPSIDYERDIMSESLALLDDYKRKRENAYSWLYKQEEISTQNYLAFLQQKLEGTEMYSDEWIRVQSDIQTVEQKISDDRKARWLEETRFQRRTLDIMLGNLENFWMSTFDLDMTGAERRKMLFQGIAMDFAKWGSEMVKEEIKNALLRKTVVENAEKTRIAAVAAGVGKTIALLATEGAAAIVAAAKWIYNAAAKIFSAHAAIPFVGVAIAAGFVSAMVATLAGFKKFQEGGLIGGPRWPKDSIPIMATGGEFMMPEPAVQKIGVSALEYMRRTGEIPGTGGGDVYIDMGGFTFNSTRKEDIPLITEAVAEAVEDAIEERKLEL